MPEQRRELGLPGGPAVEAAPVSSRPGRASAPPAPGLGAAVGIGVVVGVGLILGLLKASGAALSRLRKGVIVPGLSRLAPFTGGVVPGAGSAAVLPVLYVLPGATSSSTAAWENVARVPLAANTTYLLVMVAGVTCANTTNTKLRLQNMAGLAGVWGLLHGRESGISGDTSNSYAAVLTDEISFDVNETIERGLNVWIKVTTGDDPVQLEIELQTASNGSARTIEAGGALVVEELAADAVTAAVADSNTSTSVPKTALTVTVPANETRLLFCFLPHTGAATATGVKWTFGCSGGTFRADVFDTRSTLFADFATRTDGTEVNHGSGIAGTRLSLVWAVVVAGSGGATFTVDYATEVSDSAITMLSSGFCVSRLATSVLAGDKEATAGGGTIDVFTQAVAAGQAWLLTMAGGHTTNHTNNEMKMGIDGIPSGGGAQWTGMWLGGGLELMSTRSTTMPSKEVGTGQGPTPGPVVNMAAVWADADPATFALRMSAEHTATVLAGAALVAQRCTIGTMPGA